METMPVSGVLATIRGVRMSALRANADRAPFSVSAAQ